MQDLSFLLPNTVCECDLGARCGNHDDEAEEAYWAREYDTTHRAHVIDVDVYEPGDPKGFVL